MDTFVAELSADGTKLLYGTYLGGSGVEIGSTSELDANGDIWLANSTNSTNYPVTSNALQAQNAGGYDVALIELSPDGTKILYSTYLGGSGDESSNYNSVYIQLDAAGNVHLAGSTNSTNFPVTADAFQPLEGGDADVFYTVLGSVAIGTIGPVVGGNTGDTTVTIGGSGFESGATCELVQGGTTIASVAATVNSTGTGITCTFPLNGTTTGSYDVVVANPNGGSTFTSPGAFTVENGGQPDLSVSIVGRPEIRTGVPSTFYVTVTNLGSEDADFVPLWVTLPNNIKFSFDGLSPQDSTSYSYNDGTTYYSNVMLPQVAPGQTQTIPLQITSAQDSPGISLTATLQPPWFASIAEVLPALSSGSYSPTCVPDPINGYALNCFGPYLIAQGLGTISFAPFPQVDTKLAGYALLMGKGVVPAATPQKCDLANSTAYSSGFMAGQNDRKKGNPWGTTPNPYTLDENDPYDRKTWQTGYNYGYDSDLSSLYTQPPPTPLLRPGSASAGSASDLSRESPRPADAPSCTAPPPSPPPNLPPPARVSPPSKNSIDPNFKSGPTGDASASQYVRGSAALTYDVGFENEATASLPAAAVVVTDQLDPTKVDLTTLSLGTISFGSNVISLPSGSTNYTTTYAPPGVTNYVVRIQGSLNSSTSLLKWTFQTIDPTTGLPPSDPIVGFLPPDADGIKGQGSVLFNVMPKGGQTTGTQITNTATVVFDANAPIQIPTWLNTLDVDAPVSKVVALPATETATAGTSTFNVSWSGTDKGSGIASYTIYVSDNGDAFTAWQSAVTTTSASYTGTVGHTYGFYSIATDNAGNVEAAKTSADTSTTVPPPTLLASSTTLTSSSASIASGSSVTFTAVEAPPSGTTAVPTGTVTFLNGTTTLGKGTLNGSGTATYITTSLPVGTDSITAQYGGDAVFAASTSAAVNVVVGTPAFSLSLSPTSVSVASGGSGTTTVTVTPAFGFSSAITFACSGLPAYATCTFSPASVTPSGTAASTTALTIATNVTTTSLQKDLRTPRTGERAPLLCIALLGAIGLFRARRQHRELLRGARSLAALTVLLLALAGGALIGCGGGSSHSTPSGTSTATITGTGGTQTQTATLSVRVQ